MLVAGAAALLAQEPAPTRPLSFEVASVRPVVWTAGHYRRVEDQSRVEYRQISLLTLIRRAYPDDFDVLGPPWIRQGFYDVVAKMPAGATKDDIPGMLQRMLKERFHFVTHQESRMTKVYDLVVEKGGPKLQPCQVGDEPAQPHAGSQDNPPATGVCPSNHARTFDETTMSVTASTMTELARDLRTGTAWPVLDKTGLQGNFNIAFECEQDLGKTTVGLPSMASALDKFGLKLEATREPLEYVVIDSADRVPTEN
ncbi:MAG TPA: TIGR03435 family protein [Bryobacteraceae bacterium]|nr:TIGR03435 family protein [Bryobacteraceae bacterium]